MEEYHEEAIRLGLNCLYIIIIIIIIIIWNFITMDQMGECETMVGKMMAKRMLKDNTILVWCSLFACIHVQLK